MITQVLKDTNRYAVLWYNEPYYILYPSPLSRQKTGPNPDIEITDSAIYEI